MRFCELCSLSSYNVFRVETSLRRLHDNSIVEFPNWHVSGANGLGNQTTISQQTHCGEIMCRILILLCVCTEHSVSRRAHLCLSSRISKRAYVLSSNHWNSACFHASPMFTQCGRISTLTRYPCHTSTTASIRLIFSLPFLSLSHFLQTIAIHTPDNVM